MIYFTILEKEKYPTLEIDKGTCNMQLLMFSSHKYLKFQSIYIFSLLFSFSISLLTTVIEHAFLPILPILLTSRFHKIVEHLS